MNSKSSDKCAVLKDQSGNPVPLTGIDVRATIDDVLTRACITQTYENREELNIEAVYTFPLLLDAVLLDFTVRIDGKVRRGTVMKKSTARADYENAVEQGDSAAMLENTGDGLYSMSVGNLLAGQKIEISFSYAYPNVWNGRLLRYRLHRYMRRIRTSVQLLLREVWSVLISAVRPTGLNVPEQRGKFS